MAAEPTPLRPLAAPSRDARSWRQAELEDVWFARVEKCLELLRKQPQMGWTDVARYYDLPESTLRVWRRRYWQSKAP